MLVFISVQLHFTTWYKIMQRVAAFIFFGKVWQNYFQDSALSSGALVLLKWLLMFNNCEKASYLKAKSGLFSKQLMLSNKNFSSGVDKKAKLSAVMTFISTKTKAFTFQQKINKQSHSDWKIDLNAIFNKYE